MSAEYIQRRLRSQGSAAPSPDAALARVASQYGQALAELPASSPGQARSYLRFLLEREGVRDATVRAVALPFTSAGTLRRALNEALERLRGNELTHFGLGTAAALSAAAGVPDSRTGGSQLLALLLVRRRVELGPLSPTVGRPLRLCGRLLRGRRPQVLVTYPSGSVAQRRPGLAHGRFCVELPPVERGEHAVEVMVDGPFGPEVAALFPLRVGVSGPRQPVQKLYPPETTDEPDTARRLLALVNGSRRASGLRPLAWATHLERVARAHSRDMLDGGFFGHRSPRNGGLAARLRAAQVEYEEASENLVLATSARRAHDRLMSSPAHRRNILDPELTHVGIGVATEGSRAPLLITQCFARLTPAPQPEAE
ncbi:MAG: hypothetical protein IT371_15060 [Deltaproteobacteria bacterium]|nr:hypothetical protein [Deltaproteobacteria bacterium]